MNQKSDEPLHLKAIQCRTEGDCVYWVEGEYCNYPGKIIINPWARCACFASNYEKRKRDLKESVRKMLDP